ncbi:carboxypeptidase N subunit 2 [Chrysoperla carnea]|uniref:carboxypeptidase N subunit 2 n=1 Tax=Chrysoperla carnea TaxID=189513 RepID=UPI001D08FB58|nr:carboxypeptidase N subunit 2 [Chrysoperla carnea]
MQRPFLLTSLQILFQMIVVTICAKINHLDLISAASTQIIPWRCPEIAQQPAVECSCDMPHTLRCNGDRPEAMQIIGRKLRSLPPVASVSLLDCTVQNVSALPGPLFEGVALHGLVVSSGAIKDVHKHAFMGLASPLQALGLPNNQLSTIPTAALAALPTLDRLDLSHNLLRKLDNSSFKSLENLTFLDLSDNKISEISEDAFTTLPQLKTLRLRGNGLTITTIQTLKPLPGINDLDLSSNSLIGPLGRRSISPMPTLQILQLSHNAISSLKKGALKGFISLVTLMLHHNQIDVLEDHAFENLSNLTQLDLSHNRIVAVSGASLAHLHNLLDLDLSHNFLRAITADLILPLENLKSLNLDDNDISIIASDAFQPNVKLTKLNLADNPLNCDCSLIEFAVWLSNSEQLSSEDKKTIICMTPPSLENALLSEINSENLHCGEDEHEPIMAPPPPSSLIDDVPVANIRVTLRNLTYTANQTIFEWSIDENTTIPYTCDSLFIYEDLQNIGEMLIETHKITCNNSDDNFNHITLINENMDLEMNHKYRFCIVLFEGNSHSDDISLIVESHYIFTGLLDHGPYQICALIILQNNTDINNNEEYINSQQPISTTATSLSRYCVPVEISGGGNHLCKPKVQSNTLENPHHQYFLPPSSVIEDEQHSRYVKLHATTKL